MRLNAHRLAAVLVSFGLVGCAVPAEPPTTPAPVALTPSPTEVSLVGKALDGGGPVFRLMEDGHIRHISDLLTFYALGYTPGAVTPVDIGILGGYPLGMPLTRWATGEQDRRLYFLQKGKRYLIRDADALRNTGGSPIDVSQYPDAFLNTFPVAGQDIPPAVPAPPETSQPVAAIRHGGAIWVADDSGLLTRWDMATGEHTMIDLPKPVSISALANDEGAIWLGTRQGSVWQLPDDGKWSFKLNDVGWVSALAADTEGGVWIASSDTYDFQRGSYQFGQGLIHLNTRGDRQPAQYLAPQSLSSDPTRRITTLAFDAPHDVLWLGTSYAGLFRYEPATQVWANFSIFTRQLPDTHVNDLKLMADGSLWIGTFAGITTYRGGEFDVQKSLNRRIKSNTLSLQVAADGSVWATGENYVSHLTADQPVVSYTAFDHPFFNDTFIAVLLDDHNLPWLVGGHHLLHWDGDWWHALDSTIGEQVAFSPGALRVPDDAPPRDFPSPQTDYQRWLETWPRPTHDNGWCIHYLQTPSGDDFEVRQQIYRMERMNLRWVLVNYTTRSQLISMAPRFKQAGITVIWRPFVRPYEVYYHWAEDVAFLRSQGIAPYMQIYNEASIEQEWDGQPVDQEKYLTNLLPAIQAVYDAGGYVGLQDIGPSWTQATIDRIRAAHMEIVYDRVFFIPHPYGANHPPAYDEDITGVLGFREYASLFQNELGFVPVMIAGEGGWRPGDTSDTRYPPIDAALHADYNAQLFGWFSTGLLSNGDPLPDYLFAFCPWLLSDPNDRAAWFDGPDGDLTQTTDRIAALPDTDRLFSWQRTHP